MRGTLPSRSYSNTRAVRWLRHKKNKMGKHCVLELAGAAPRLRLRNVAKRDGEEKSYWQDVSQDSQRRIDDETVEWQAGPPGALTATILREHFEAHSAKESEWQSQFVDFFRLFSNRWSVELRPHGQTYKLCFPEELRKLGFLPRGEGARVVFFGFGDIVEIWRPDDWLGLICAASAPSTTPQMLHEMLERGLELPE